MVGKNANKNTQHDGRIQQIIETLRHFRIRSTSSFPRRFFFLRGLPVRICLRGCTLTCITICFSKSAVQCPQKAQLAQESTYAQCLSLEIESNGRGHVRVHKFCCFCRLFEWCCCFWCWWQNACTFALPVANFLNPSQSPSKNYFPPSTRYKTVKCLFCA